VKDTGKKLLLYTVIAYLLFLVFWGVGQVFSNVMTGNGRWFSLLFFFIVYMAILGIAAPLYLGRKFGLKLHSPISTAKTLWGFVFLALFVAIGVFFSGALPILAQNPPTAGAVAKYLLLFLPMALGISLYSTFLIPRAVVAAVGKKALGIILAVIVSAISLSLGFLVDSLFSDLNIAIVMLVLGLLLGLGSVLTQSIIYSYPALFVVILVNSLSEAKYFGENWWTLVIGFSACCAVVFYFWLFRAKNK
jgi:hypothetical protein